MTNVNLLEVARGLGQDTARGNDSLTMLAMQATAWAAESLAGPDDAESIYLAYAEGVNTSLFGGKITVDNPKTLKVQVSCFRSFLKPEVAKNGEVHGVTLQVRASMKGTDETKSAYNSLVAVNRAQIKKGPIQLTQKEIREILTPKEKEDKQLSVLLAELHKRVTKFDDEHKVAGFQKVILEFNAFMAGYATGSEIISTSSEMDKEDKSEANKMDKSLMAVMLSSLGTVKNENTVVQ